jgi:DNA-directed RNA polymerase specialized sigma24 family protein
MTSPDITEREAARRARLAAQREATRVYKDVERHTWRETAEHFGIKERATKYRVYRARKERAAEAEERVQPPLPLEERAQQELSFESDPGTGVEQS